MKIAAFFSQSPFASWGQAEGFARVLKRMGHDVVDIPIPPVKTVTSSQIAKINKPVDDCDLIIVSGPEHLRDWINQFYPHWNNIKAPKAGWYHESFIREDQTIVFENFRSMFDFHFFPDKDDAEKYNGKHLPLGVDVDMFRRAECCCNYDNGEGCTYCGWKRDIDSAFIGLMYPKRQRFAEELKPYLKGLKLRIANGNILVHDFDGINLERSTELLAETYRRINVFVAFPSVCNVLVAKILESMASGCYLVASEQPVELKNYASYKTAKECAREIREALEANIYREKIARQGREEVHKNHRMELRFEKLFEVVGEQKAYNSGVTPQKELEVPTHGHPVATGCCDSAQ